MSWSPPAPPAGFPPAAGVPASPAPPASADRYVPNSAGRTAARLVVTAVVGVPIAVATIVFGIAAMSGSNLFAGGSGAEGPSMPASQATEGAIAAIGLYLVVAIVLAWITRPRQVRPDPPTMELGDDQVPPALAGYLVNLWLTPREAAQGTLLDLGARHFLTFEQTQRGRVLVRLNPAADTASLMPYELRVLNHVRSLAANGTVPGEALATWPRENPNAWFSAFGNEVAADARRRGLAQRRWPPWTSALFAVLAALAASLSALAVSVGSNSGHGHNDNASALFVGVVVWLVLSGAPFVIRTDRDTARGRVAAAHWLGVRSQLFADEVFPTLPPSAIAVWDRYLGYGAAFGAAGEAVRELPLGAEDPTHAWSSVGGRWRMVTVRYPGFRPGWGVSPGGLIGRGVALLVVGLIPLTLLAASANLNGVLPAVIALLGLALAGWGAWDLTLGALDARRRRWVIGRVLRTRAVKGQHNATLYYWVAVDDGTSPTVLAWHVPTVKGRMITEGMDVTAVITPLAAHVMSIEQRSATIT